MENPDFYVVDTGKDKIAIETLKDAKDVLERVKRKFPNAKIKSVKSHVTQKDKHHFDFGYDEEDYNESLNNSWKENNLLKESFINNVLMDVVFSIPADLLNKKSVDEFNKNYSDWEIYDSPDFKLDSDDKTINLLFNINKAILKLRPSEDFLDFDYVWDFYPKQNEYRCTAGFEYDYDIESYGDENLISDEEYEIASDFEYALKNKGFDFVDVDATMFY